MITTTTQRTPGSRMPFVATVAPVSSTLNWHDLAYGTSVLAVTRAITATAPAVADADATATKAQPAPVVSPASSPPV